VVGLFVDFFVLSINRSTSHVMDAFRDDSFGKDRVSDKKRLYNSVSSTLQIRLL